ncbi:MAG: hypothetical protein JO032_16035, partial [Alphaproteobacteria bacterium]|nr:hypothetical protein [Alphaproteobacteria bacterium]
MATLAGAAVADQKPADGATAGSMIRPTDSLGGRPMGDAIIEIAAVTQQIAQIAANVALVAPSAGAT